MKVTFIRALILLPGKSFCTQGKTENLSLAEIKLNKRCFAVKQHGSIKQHRKTEQNVRTG
jgi:hypothetical protein